MSRGFATLAEAIESPSRVYRGYHGFVDADAAREWQDRWNAEHPEAVRAMQRRANAKRRQRMASDPEYAAKRKAIARRTYQNRDPRRRFARRANIRVGTYGRPEDVLDWHTIPDGPWACSYCGIPCESWDHVVPLIEGGANSAANLVPSCVPCNQHRTAGRYALPKATCRRGHEYTPENTLLRPTGERRCRICTRANRRSYHERFGR